MQIYVKYRGEFFYSFVIFNESFKEMAWVR